MEALAQTIQIALAPVFLLVAMGSLLNVVTGRLARVVDRSRELMTRHAETSGDEHTRLVAELRMLGSGPITYTFEASKWQRYRREMAASDSNSIGKGISLRDRSHFGVLRI